MNRYFYVPVMESCLQHDGVSMREHLRIVDPEIYQREKDYKMAFSSLSFEEGKLPADAVEKVCLQDHVLHLLYHSRTLARHLILVQGDSGALYELASLEAMDPINLQKLEAYEISGEDVVELFMEHHDYVESAVNFFDTYEKKKDIFDEVPKREIPRKVKGKIPFFRKKK